MTGCRTPLPVTSPKAAAWVCATSPTTTAPNSPRGPGRARTCTTPGCSRRTPPPAYAAYAQRLIEDPAKAGFLVCEKEADGALAGFVNINNIVEGGFLCGALGYGAFAHAAGRGLMREALDLLVRYAFGPMRLHRLEINVQPGNAASIALARACGFRKEGFSPKMLFIDGAWRDHERWALTSEMLTGDD